MPAAQAAEAHVAAASPATLSRGAALPVPALESTGGASASHPGRSLGPALFSRYDIVVLVIVLAVAMIPVLFKRELDTFDGYGFSLRRVPPAKSAAAPAPTTSAIQQAQDAAPRSAEATIKAPPSAATAKTAGQAQNSSKAAQPPVQKNARPSQEQAKMMDDQLRTPTRLQMKATQAEPAPLPQGGFAAADIDGADNGKAIGAAFGSPKQLTQQIPSQQVISLTPGAALGLLIQKTQPVYPLIAKESPISGTVVLAASISKTGTVDKLRVVSGPVIFRMSAVNAVRSWRFKPYMLDNQPTAFETTINVRFCLTQPCDR